MDSITIAIVLTAVLVAVVLILRPKQAIIMRKPKIGITGAKIFYTDQKEEKANKKEGIVYGKILYSQQYDIQGKPDYIFKKRSGQLIPVELKSGSISDDETMPHQGDLIQLAAYFLIIEDVYGIRPKEGRLVYKNKMFIIKNTKAIRNQVEDTIDDMRQMLETGQGDCEPSFVKCRYCLCRGTVCEYSK
jgi:CRISPR-associated exonuclease Cas4